MIFWITVIAVLIGVFLFWNSRPVSRTPEDVIETLEKWLQGELTDGEWDYFECCHIKDPDLEKIRGKCAELSIDPAFTRDPEMGPGLNEAGREEVRKHIKQVKELEARNAT